MHSRKEIATLIVALVMGCIAITGCAQAEQLAGAVENKSSAARDDVYFVGLDHFPAGASGKRVAKLFGAAPTDRWSLSGVARGIAKQLGDESIGLDAPIDRWNPATDPYNFGLIVLRGVSHRTLTWQGTNSRTQVAVDIAWLQVGHDSRTRMQQEKLPELRYGVSVYDVPEFNSQLAPTAVELDGFYRDAFNQAVQKLLRLVKQRAKRELQRNTAGLRYLMVQPPVVLARAKASLARFPAGDELVMERLSRTLGSYLENKLFEQFKTERAFDEFVLLPNAETVEYLQTEWNSFATRVAALSTYNAAAEALGFRTPRLLRVAPFCSVAAEDQVHALEIRSNIVDVKTTIAPQSAHVEWVDITAYLAADVKITLDSSRDTQPSDAVPALQASATSRPIQKPIDIDAAEFVGLHSAIRAIGFASDPLAVQLSKRLHELLAAPPLSHPSYQRFCP